LNYSFRYYLVTKWKILSRTFSDGGWKLEVKNKNNYEI
jgi:hypothetical protein